MISIETLDSDQQQAIEQWPVWEKEPSEFDWDYTEKEQFFILTGAARLTTACGLDKCIKPGDFVTVEQGILVHWQITQPIRKQYKFFK